MMNSPLLTLNLVILTFIAFMCPPSHAAELPFFQESDLTPYWEAEFTKNPQDNLHSPATVKPFKVTNQEGQIITETNLRGKLSLVSFFFASCGSTCPTLMNSIQKTQAKLKKMGQNSHVQIYSFSVMPEHDTAEVLKNYSKMHHLDLSNWNLLTGDHDEIYRIGKGMFKADRSIGGKKSKSSFIHSEDIYLVDPQLRIRGIYAASNAKQMELLAQDMNQLKRSPQK